MTTEHYLSTDNNTHYTVSQTNDTHGRSTL